MSSNLLKEQKDLVAKAKETKQKLSAYILDNNEPGLLTLEMFCTLNNISQSELDNEFFKSLIEKMDSKKLALLKAKRLNSGQGIDEEIRRLEEGQEQKIVVEIIGYGIREDITKEIKRRRKEIELEKKNG